MTYRSETCFLIFMTVVTFANLSKSLAGLTQEVCWSTFCWFKFFYSWEIIDESFCADLRILIQVVFSHTNKINYFVNMFGVVDKSFVKIGNNIWWKKCYVIEWHICFPEYLCLTRQRNVTKANEWAALLNIPVLVWKWFTKRIEKYIERYFVFDIGKFNVMKR